MKRLIICALLAFTSAALATSQKNIAKKSFKAENDEQNPTNIEAKSQKFLVTNAGVGAHNVNDAYGDKSSGSEVDSELAALGQRRTRRCTPPPDSFDWRTQLRRQILTPVKDQGKCGASYAFAATAALETFIKWRRHAFKDFDLSEQAIIDCTYGKYGDNTNNGCEGGRPENVFIYFNETGFISEEDYTFTSRDSKRHGTCKKVRPIPDYPKGGLKFHTLRVNVDAELLDPLIKKGPFIVALSLDKELETKFRNLKDEVFPHHNLMNDNGTHYVIVVGYGFNEAEGRYWILKNSWGTDWGEGGYGKIRRENTLNGKSSAIFIDEAY